MTPHFRLQRQRLPRTFGGALVTAVALTALGGVALMRTAAKPRAVPVPAVATPSPPSLIKVTFPSCDCTKGGSKPTTLGVPDEYSDPEKLAAEIRYCEYRPHANVAIALTHIPSVDKVAALVPEVIRVEGNTLFLKNETKIALVHAQTAAEEKAEFESYSVSRDDLVQEVAQEPDAMLISVRYPGRAEFVELGTKKSALGRIRGLPTGSYVRAATSETDGQGRSVVIVSFPRLR